MPALHRSLTRRGWGDRPASSSADRPRARSAHDASPDTLGWLVVSLIQARQFRRMHTTAPSTALEHDLLAHILDALQPQS